MKLIIICLLSMAIVATAQVVTNVVISIPLTAPQWEAVTNASTRLGLSPQAYLQSTNFLPLSAVTAQREINVIDDVIEKFRRADPVKRQAAIDALEGRQQATMGPVRRVERNDRR